MLWRWGWRCVGSAAILVPSRGYTEGECVHQCVERCPGECHHEQHVSSIPLCVTAVSDCL